jgi:hypothetical protein
MIKINKVGELFYITTYFVTTNHAILQRDKYEIVTIQLPKTQ